MGNCAERYSPEDKHRHYCKDISKNEKKFIYVAGNPELFSESPQFTHQVEKTLKHEKKKFKELNEACVEQKSFTERLVFEVQKGQNLSGPNCLTRDRILVRVSLCPGGPYFDTAFCDFELPAWNECSEFTEKISKYDQVKFTVFKEKPEKNLKSKGNCSINISNLSSQIMFFDWLPLENCKNPESKLLIKLQWVYNEPNLYQELLKECETRLKKLKIFN